MNKFILIFLFPALFIFSCAHAEKKEIKSSEIIKLLKKGEPIQIIDKIILDDLNFTSIDNPIVLNANSLQTIVNSPVFFQNCVFMEKVSSNGILKSVPVQSCFKNNLIFINCDFRGDVDFDKATIYGMMNFNQSVFRENTNFNNMAVWAKDSYFSEVKAEKKFTMIYSSFMGNLFFVDSEFQNILSLQETSIKGKLSFNNAKFYSRTDFSLVDIWGQAFFNYAVFSAPVDFSSAKFYSNVDFINTTFNKEIQFSGAFFYNTVRTENMKSNELIDLSKTQFIIGNPKF